MIVGILDILIKDPSLTATAVSGNKRLLEQAAECQLQEEMDRIRWHIPRLNRLGFRAFLAKVQ